VTEQDADLRERSIGELFGKLTEDMGLLMRQEVALAKAEASEKVAQLGVGAGLVAGGGLIAFAGFLALLAAAVLGLSNVLAPWLAALIVGVVVLVVGAALAWIGKTRLTADKLAPRRTIRSLQDDATWAKEQVR